MIPRPAPSMLSPTRTIYDISVEQSFKEKDAPGSVRDPPCHYALLSANLANPIIGGLLNPP